MLAGHEAFLHGGSPSQYFNQFRMAPGETNVSIPRAFIRASVAFALTFVPFLTTSASGQSPAAPAEDSKVGNGCACPPAVTDSASSLVQEQSISVQAASTAPQPNDDRYRDGIIIRETPADAKVPFLLRFNINTQLRYLNTLSSDETYTDHLGVVREVHRRNDITVNRAMFIFGGYIFDQRARYSFTVWTSAGAASIIVASNIGWQFNRKLTVTGGYTGVPGSRSLVNTSHIFRRSTGQWRTTSSVPASPRAPGRTENSSRTCITWRSSATVSTH